ncbi:TonB-dependent receptor [Niveispirillum sp.]|uniref:TonB-dependent receptor n=1 Tax=Niveispirillum sp. TaxID=1917217 RepID=UPI001B46F2D3|nr:TonB-dependent receptor [Niveispirillum sp.]MBP7334320.1 TonB-dependent receptor [Niveispirillum sp.]
MSKSEGSRRLRWSVASTALLLAAGVLPAAAEELLQLEEIIVTARRMEENLQRTPVAVTAVSEADLRDKNIESLLDIGAVAPNVMVGSQSANGGLNGGFFIRGIGQDRSGIGFDQGVGIYVDDIYQSRSDNSLIDIVDVERVEVLRGPQGTLFGKNTIGGAIRYITKAPSSKAGGYVDATVGSYDRADIKASVNVPLTETLFVKATVGSLNRDGYIKHVVDNDRDGDQDTQVGQVQVRALLSDRLTVDLSAAKTRSKNSGRAYIIDYIDAADTFPTRFRAKTGLPFDNRFASTGPYTRYGGDNTSYSYDGYTLSGVINFDVTDDISLKSITGYMQADIMSANDWDGTQYQVYDIVNDRKIDQFSQEFQLSGAGFDNRFHYVGGLYYLTESPVDNAIVYTAFDAQFPAPRLTSQSQTVDSYAAFAQGTYSLTEQLSVTGGLRYSRDDKSAKGSRADTRFSGTGEGSWDDVSSRASIEYQWNDDVMTYAAVTKGFRSGGINIGTAAPVVFTKYDPETVWNYEGGIRSDLLDRRLRLNITGFHMDYTDQQLTALNQATNTIFMQNVGSSHRTGLEVETQALVAEGWRLEGTFGYLEAKYDDVGTATGITKNSRVLRSPKYTYTLGSSYTVPVGAGTMTSNLNYNYRSKQSTTSTDTNSVLLDGYGLLNARIQYDAPDEAWSVAVQATNLADKVYYIGGIDFARREALTGVSQLDVGRPREFAVNFRYRF